MSRWFRAYDEAVDDPKIQRLPGDVFKALFNLWCIASQNGGELPCNEDIAFKLRQPMPKVATLISKLTEAGLIDEDETGRRPHNWNGRQFKGDVSTERVQRHRKRKGNVSSAVSETPPEQSRTETEQNSSSGSARDLLAELRKAAGWEQEPHPNLFITGPIEALLQNGVDLDLDVLPTIRAIAPQAGSRTTWKYFLKAIVRARNDRLAAISSANDFSDRSPTNGANRQKHSRTRNFAILDAIVAEAERREDEEGGGSGENLAPRAA